MVLKRLQQKVDLFEKRSENKKKEKRKKYISKVKQTIHNKQDILFLRVVSCSRASFCSKLLLLTILSKRNYFYPNLKLTIASNKNDHKKCLPEILGYT